MTQTGSLVRRLAERGRLSHAYLVTGPAGPEREALTLALAQALVCGGERPPCGLCPHCKKVRAGIHPDVTTVAPAEDKREILVDQIRALRSDAYVLPNEAGRKVYVIRPADAMNPAAQNSLLKVLEEGPAYAAFLLETAVPGALLPTVRSRCEQLTLPPAQESTVLSPEAEALADLMLRGDESALLARCVALEKLEREAFRALLRETALALKGRMREDLSLAGRVLPKIDLLQKLDRAAQFHVSAGHLAGWLCAASFE